MTIRFHAILFCCIVSLLGVRAAPCQSGTAFPTVTTNVTYKLTADYQGMYVSALLNGQAQAQLLVDTGAFVTVLHEGSMLAEGSLDQVSADPRVVEVYLGR